MVKQIEKLVEGKMNWEEERLLYRIAKLYYEEGYTQAKISKELGIYRTTIGRMLKKAQDKGIVKIQIQSSSDALFDLEDKIAKHFGMKEVIVVPSYKNQSNQDKMKSIGKACGSLLDRIILDDDIVGVAWGTTLGNMIHQLDELKPKKSRMCPISRWTWRDEIRLSCKRYRSQVIKCIEWEVTFY